MIWIFTEVVMGLNPGYLLKSLLLYFSIFSCLEVIFWFFWFCKHLWWHRKYYVKSWVSEFKYMFKNSLTPLCHTSPHIMIPCRCLKSQEKSELVDQGNRNQEKSNYSFLSLLHCTLMCDQLWSFNTKWFMYVL